MPQLVPIFFVNQVLFTLIILTLIFLTLIILSLIFYLFSKYILPWFEFSLTLTVCLTSFYYIKSKLNILISRVKSILLEVKQIIIKFVNYTLNKLSLIVTGITNIWRKYLLKGLLNFFFMALGILSFFLFVGLGLVYMCLFHSVLFWNIFPFCLTSFYSLKSKLNRLISKVKYILIVVNNLIYMLCFINWIDILCFFFKSELVRDKIEIWREYLIKGLQTFFLIVFLGLAFIFLFKPVLFKQLLLLLIPLLKVLFGVPINIFVCDSSFLSVKIPWIGAPVPGGGPPQVYVSYDNGNTDFVYPGNYKSAHYTEKVNAFWKLDPHLNRLRQGIWVNPTFESINEAYDIYLEGINEGKNTSKQMNTHISKFKKLICSLSPNTKLGYNGPHDNIIYPWHPENEYWFIEGESSEKDTNKLKEINRTFIRYNWHASDMAHCIDKVQSLETYGGIKFYNPDYDSWMGIKYNLDAVGTKGTPDEILNYANSNNRTKTEFHKLPLRFHT